MLELLDQLDSFSSDERIKVIAATNRIDIFIQCFYDQTKDYNDIGGLNKQIEELVKVIVLPMSHAERFKGLQLL
jgi:ATP-dependent 26S proteasome regulatory subunit